MDDYLTKPIRRDQLAAGLARFAGESPAPTEAVGPGPALDKVSGSSTPGDRHLLGELLGIFLAGGPGHLQALRDAVARSDPAALMRAAHTLSGSLKVSAPPRPSRSSGPLKRWGARVGSRAPCCSPGSSPRSGVRSAAAAAMAGERRGCLTGERGRVLVVDVRLRWM